MQKVLFLVASDWYFWAHWHPLALGVQAEGFDVVIVTPDGKYVPAIRELGLRHVPLSMSRQGRNPLSDVQTLSRLVTLYKKEKPDLVHHIAIKPIIYGSVAAHIAAVPAVVNTMPGMGYVFLNPQPLSRAIRPFVRGTFRATLHNPRSRLVLLNEDNADKWHQWGARPDRVRIVKGAGVRLDRFPVNEEPSGLPLVILPARLLFDKGVREFIEAVRMLRAKNIPARFALVGEPDVGNPASVTFADMEGWEKEGLVELFGWRDDMPSVYAESSIVCLPSYGEGVPQSLVEAIACGRSVIATDVPGCRDVVRHEQNGLLVPAKSAGLLASAIERLILDPALRRRLGKRGRQIAEEEYAIEKIVQKNLSIYREILPEKPGG